MVLKKKGNKTQRKRRPEIAWIENEQNNGYGIVKNIHFAIRNGIEFLLVWMVLIHEWQMGRAICVFFLFFFIIFIFIFGVSAILCERMWHPMSLKMKTVAMYGHDSLT